jgi:hypothetical protein
LILSIISHNKKEPGSGKVIDTSRTRLRRRIPPICIIHIEEAEVKRELGKLVCGIAACAYAHQRGDAEEIHCQSGRSLSQKRRTEMTLNDKHAASSKPAACSLSSWQFSATTNYALPCIGI